MGSLIDLTGQRFGKLVVIKRIPNTTQSKQAVTWDCKCDCGNHHAVGAKELRSGNTKTCGCSRFDPRPGAVKHGKCNTRLYRIWGNMKHRCYGKSDVDKYQYYGGRGIRVCDDWHDFNSFQLWAFSTGYNDSLTLDRINNNGNYCPENCQWTTVKEQCMNRRSNHYIKENGETLSIKQWAGKLNVSHATILNRTKNGGSVYGNLHTLAEAQ